MMVGIPQKRGRNSKAALLGIAALICCIGVALYIYFPITPSVPQGTVDSTGTTTTPGDPPRFEDYPREVVPPPSKTVSVDWSSNPNAAMFRTAITKGMLTGPVYAGEYAVASWGCGTSCQGNALIDVLTGDIVVFGLPSAYGLGYQVDSALLVVNPPASLPDPDGAGPVTTDYYLFENGKLTLIDKRDPFGKKVACSGSPGLYKNPQTDETVEFQSKCMVPFGWEKIQERATGITGKVSIATCPVLQEGVPCTTLPEAYTSRSIVVLDEGGVSEVAVSRIRSDGTYLIPLPPGHYIVDIVHIGIDTSHELPKKITVPEGGMVTFDFSIDTGIR